MCVSEPLCAYYCSYSPGKKPRRIERTAISDAEPEGREVAEEHKKKGGETEEQCAEREGEYLSLQGLQWRHGRGILIIRRKKKKRILREKTR